MNVTKTETREGELTAYIVTDDAGRELGVVAKQQTRTPVMASDRGLHFSIGSTVRTEWFVRGDRYRIGHRTREIAIRNLIRFGA